MPDFSVFIGTRPEIIKMAPLLIELEKKKADFELVFTGQHYDYNMSKIFFEEFGIREPEVFFKASAKGQFQAMAGILCKTAERLQKSRPKICIVNGDTNTTLASGLAAAKSAVSLAHIEAGCRSFDPAMPEEVNRLLVDRVSSLLFPPTPHCEANLIAEGISEEKIFMHGNTNSDVFALARPKAEKRRKHSEFGVEKGNYVLATLHRPSNVDSKEPLSNLLSALNSLGKKVIFPIHPRTRKNIRAFGLETELEKGSIIPCEPLSYFDFLSLTLGCAFMVSDSGGGMEDAALAGKRCIVPRQNVEWYELVENKMVFLCRPIKEEVLAAAKALNLQGAPKPVYTEKNPSQKIAQTLLEKAGEKGLLSSRDFQKDGRLGLFLGNTQVSRKTLSWKKIGCW